MGVGHTCDGQTQARSGSGAIDAVLSEGAARARAIAQPIVDETKEIVGFLR